MATGGFIMTMTIQQKCWGKKNVCADYETSPGK